MLVSLTVGKVDAGVAVLLTEDKRLIEFPSILLPPDISSGSIVDITVSRNHISEATAAKAFASLQNDIHQTFGKHTPAPPVLRCRNATQTSVVLEWDPIQLATAELRSLSLYRNGSKAGSIPRPLETKCTKISGLAVDSEYTFHLVLRSSAGTYSSDKLTVRTHKMTELSGITITPGIMPAPLRESLQKVVGRIGAKLIDTVRIDTTHFVCTEGRGQAWEKAVDMNIPVVVPDWVHGCEREGRIVGVRGYYLNADPRLRQVGPSVSIQQQPRQSQSQQMVDSPRMEITPPTPQKSVPTSAPQSNEKDTGDAVYGKPPPPPPKDEKPIQESAEPKAAVDEPKARKEDVKPASPAPVGYQSDAAEKTEREIPADKTLEAGEHDENRRTGGFKTPDDTGSFHDVDL